MSEEGTIIAGGSSGRIHRAAERYSNMYGGRKEDWVKKTSSEWKEGPSEGVYSKFQTHWVENLKTGQRVDVKTKFTGKLK